MAGLISGCGTVASSMEERGLDFYATPFEAIEALMEHEVLPPVIYEPCCGNGAIVLPLREAGHTVIASDIVERGCPDSQAEIDFLQTKEAPFGVEAIVSNPPFAKAEQFIHHALYNLHIPKVWMLLRLAFLEGGNLNSYKGKCRRAVLDNGHLAKVLLFRKRLPMIHREGWTGKKHSNSGMPFAWVGWSLNHTGPIVFERIAWKAPKTRIKLDFRLSPTPIEEWIQSKSTIATP